MIYFIVNPAAGNGKALSKVTDIEQCMGNNYRILVTNAPMDAKRLTLEAVSSGAQAVVAVGGDGTINETICGLVGSNVPLGIIPAGSGNDFIKSIGLSNKLTTAAYTDLIKANCPKKIDLIKMGNFYFANIGSIGIDAQIVHSSIAFKRKGLGGMSYIAATLQNVMTYKALEMCIKVDGREIYDSFALVAVCNGTDYGGGFKIAPDAKNDDGLITLCVIRKLSNAAMTTLFPSILLGAHGRLKECEFINCKQVSITYDGIRLINLDGNLYELKSPLTFSVVESGLGVLV